MIIIVNYSNTTATPETMNILTGLNYGSHIELMVLEEYLLRTGYHLNVYHWSSAWVYHHANAVYHHGDTVVYISIIF